MGGKLDFVLNLPGMTLIQSGFSKCVMAAVFDLISVLRQCLKGCALDLVFDLRLCLNGHIFNLVRNQL